MDTSYEEICKFIVDNPKTEKAIGNGLVLGEFLLKIDSDMRNESWYELTKPLSDKTFKYVGSSYDLLKKIGTRTHELRTGMSPDKAKQDLDSLRSRFPI